MDGSMDRWINGEIGGWMDGGWVGVNGWMNGEWMGGGWTDDEGMDG